MIVESLLNLFFPKTCMGCQTLLLQNESVICTLCRHTLPITNMHLQPENELHKRFYGKIDLVHASAFFYYQKKGMVQTLIHNLKYHNHQEIGQVLAAWYAPDLQNLELLKTIDYIVPVPLHKKKLRQRGYNQLTRFGETLSEALTIPMDTAVLTRKKYSKTQSQKNSEKRKEGLENVFEANTQQKYHNKHFLLIDDVITTGATLEACCIALQNVHQCKISIICMAVVA